MIEQNEPKILFWDLETLMNPEEVMKIFPGMSNYPGLTLKASINSIICFGYKYLGDKEASCINAWDFPGWEYSTNDDGELVAAAYEILKDADAIVTHNGKRFDLKFFNSRAVYHGFAPLPKIPHIDTCTLSRSNLFLFNNRLNTVAKYLGVEEKMDNGGWELWIDVQKRDPGAMEIMTEYCKQDVEVLEQVFMKMRPFINNLPNHNIFGEGDKHVCPTCGSSHVHKHGFKRTKTQTYQRYLCQDCGSVSRSDKKDTLLRAV